MQVRVLGEVDLVDEFDGPVALGSRSQRVVLAVLATRAGSTVAHDVLVDALWPDDPPPSATRSLRTYVSRLRRHLGDGIVITPDGYRLDSTIDLDARRADDLLGRAAGASPAEARSLVAEALALWRGPSLAGLADLAALRGSAVRLDELRGSAREMLVEALLGSGAANEAIGAAEELLVDEPRRERTWALLVEALVAAQRAPDAVRAARRAESTLADAGLIPSEELRAAEQRALAGDTPVPDPRQLASAPSDLVGRSDDVAELTRLLATHRLITLVGPGGAGKTRLALEVGRELSHRHRWGARLVRLAGVHDPDAVAAVVAGSLGLTSDSAGLDAALTNAAHLDMLVVLDNCEHVADAAARVASMLTTAGPSARIIATSRSPLDLDGELVWPVGPLALDGPAEDLFVRRARSARPDVEIDEELVARIVRRVDALPLTIEMAASQARHVPLPELARRLDDEIDALRSNRRDLDERHRTLAAVVQWSERLLDDQEQGLFAEMCVFERPVSADDVERVTGRAEPEELLRILAERSLLVVDLGGRTARYGMLRTIRRRANEILARQPAHAERIVGEHARWIADALEDADRRLRTPDERRAHDRIVALLDDARRALSWCHDNDLELATRLCAALYVWGQTRLREEVLEWSRDLIDRRGHALDAAGDPAAARVYCAACFRDSNRGALDDAAHWGACAIAATDPAAFALASELVSDLALYRGDLDTAADVARSGMEAGRRAEDVISWTATTIGVALAAAYGGDHSAADAALQARPPGPLPPSAQAWLAYAEGEVLLDRDPPRALERLTTATALADSVENSYVSGVARVSTTSLQARTGDPVAAALAFVDVIDHWRGRGDQTHQLTTLRNLVALFERLDRPEWAAEMLGSVGHDGIAATYGDEAARLADARAWVRRALGSERADALEAVGGRRSVDEAAARATSWLMALTPSPPTDTA